MRGALERAFGYQGDAMNLPVSNVDEAVPFYETVLGFHVESRTETPRRSAVLARDQVRMRLTENGGDPSQDGCAFHVTGLNALLEEFAAKGIQKGASDIGAEDRGGEKWRVFYVVAPDGLCFWFGEKQ